MTNRHEDIEDIMQEVAFRIYRHVASLKHPEAFRFWLHTLVRRECLRHIEAQKNTISFTDITEQENLCIETDSDCLPAIHLENLELACELESALKCSPKLFRKIFYMRYGKGMRYRDIAADIGMKTSTVSAILLRVKKQLKRNL